MTPTRPCIAVAGAQGSVLTNIALIDGLQDVPRAPARP